MEKTWSKITSFDFRKLVEGKLLKAWAWFDRNSVRIFPYVLFLLVALFECLITFNYGYYEGHDSIFHHMQIKSYYESLMGGDVTGYISNTFLNNLGISIRMFYSTFAHTFTCMIAKLIIPMGFTLTTAMKFTNFLTFLFSGIFAYWLGLAVFKKHRMLALVFGILYLANPYKITDVYIRQAYAENFAATFIPLFYLAIYKIIDDKDVNPRNFMLLGLSTAIILLSHYVTALYAVVFGVIYIIFRIPKLLPKLKKPLFYAYFFGAVFSVVILFLPKAIPLLVQNTDDVALRLFLDVQNANYEAVAGETERSKAFFLGGYNDRGFYASFGFMAVGALQAFIIHHFAPNKKLLTFVPLAVAVGSTALYFTVAFKASHSGIIILFAGLLILFMTYRSLYRTKKVVVSKLSIFEVASWLALGAITLVLLFNKEVWKFFPDAFYQIQFPWRLWFFTVIFMGLGVLGIFAKGIELYKPGVLVLPVMAVSIFSCSCVLDTWITYNYNETNLVDNADMRELVATGWQREYLSNNYWEYIEKPSSPLYYAIRRFLSNVDYEYDYVPYVGMDIACTDYVYNSSTKGATFVIPSLPEDSDVATVYVPLFYYEGYQASMVKDDGSKVKLDVKQGDGLVSFDVESTGTVEVKFVGTTSMRFGLTLTKVFVPLATIGAMLYFGYEKLKKDKRYLDAYALNNYSL